MLRVWRKRASTFPSWATSRAPRSPTGDLRRILQQHPALSTPFGKTLRSIERERSVVPAWFAISSAGALSAWIAWALAAEVPLVETTPSGRIEYRGAVHEVESTIAARVKQRAVELGSHVEAGDLLIELDASAVSLELEKVRAEKRRRELELDALTAQIAAHTEALETSKWRGRAGVREAIAERLSLIHI